MANTPTTDAPAFAGIDLNTLPKREAPKREIDTATANKLLAVVQKNGGATDSVRYDDIEAARKAGNKARRLLDHVAPDGQRARMRSFPVDGGGFGYAVFLGEDKPRKQRADAGQSRANGNGKS